MKVGYCAWCNKPIDFGDHEWVDRVQCPGCNAVNILHWAPFEDSFFDGYQWFERAPETVTESTNGIECSEVTLRI